MKEILYHKYAGKDNDSSRLIININQLLKVQQLNKIKGQNNSDVTLILGVFQNK